MFARFVLPVSSPSCELFRTFPSSCLAVMVVAAVPTGLGPSGPNSDAINSALRNLTLGPETVSVSDLKLKRDAGTFRLPSGIVCFVAPVNGHGARSSTISTTLLQPLTEPVRTALALWSFAQPCTRFHRKSARDLLPGKRYRNTVVPD